MRKPLGLAGEKSAIVGFVLATLLVLTGLFAGASSLDAKTDRARPLYADVLEVAQFEWEQIRETGAAVSLVLGDDQPAAAEETGLVIHEHTSALTVTVSAPGYCIEAVNSFGDETGPLCFLGASRPQSVLDDRA